MILRRRTSTGCFCEGLSFYLRSRQSHVMISITLEIYSFVVPGPGGGKKERKFKRIVFKSVADKIS